MKYVTETERIYLLDDNNEIVAEVVYPLNEEGVHEILSTYVDDTLRGKGIAAQLLNRMYDSVKITGKKVVPICSYAVKFFEQNIEKRDILFKK